MTQYQEFKFLQIDPDLESIVYSFLELNDILTIFENDYKTEDKLIKKHYPELPTIDDTARSGDLKLLQYLISTGKTATPDTVDWASLKGHFEIVKYLMKSGILPTENSVDYAAEYGRIDIVKYLVEHNTSNVKYDFDAALDVAIRNGHLEIVKYLVELGTIPSDWTMRQIRSSRHRGIASYFSSKGFHDRI